MRKFDGSAFIVATIHDELLIECEEKDAREVLEITKEVMVHVMDGVVNAAEPTVPIAVEGTVTAVWTKD